jgi:hypothetical protein
MTNVARNQLTQTELIIEMFEMLSERNDLNKSQIYTYIQEEIGCPRATVRRAVSMKLRGYWHGNTRKGRKVITVQTQEISEKISQAEENAQ